MKLLELFLMETSEEDRAIISLASALWHEGLKYKKVDIEPEDRYYNDDFEDDGESIPDFEEPEEDEAINLGKIGNLVDTPLKALRNAKVELVSDYGIRKRIAADDNIDIVKKKGAYYGYWDSESRTIIINKDLIQEPTLRSAVAHELRHALDDYKSKFKANKSIRYSTPKKKEYRPEPGVNYPPGDDTYYAQPREINARFTEVLNSMVPVIRRAVREVSPEELRFYLMTEFKDALRHHSILKLFPEREKSKDYQRLMKRGVDFIGKEVQHQLQIQK